MKKLLYLVVALTIAFTSNSCTKAELDNVLNNAGLTDEEIVKGLKSALEVGTDTSVKTTNKTDGYFKNEVIKIFLPDEVKSTLDAIKLIPGGSKVVNDAILSLNRAAEDAASEAKPIFINAITNMSITEGKDILFGDSLAATGYLKTKTYADLKTTYAPKISTSLDKVNATKYWSDFATIYNTISGKKINTNLTDYTTTKALDGLFYVVGTEEMSIRKDPTARVNDILQKVFSELDKK